MPKSGVGERVIMRKVVLSLAALSLASIGAIPSVSADGMPGATYIPPPPPPLIYSWTGLYVGGAFGAHGIDADARFEAADQLTTNSFPGGSGAAPGVGFANAVAAGAFNSRSNVDGTGATFAITAGYNWQFGSFLMGFETDINGSTAGASQTVRTAATTAGGIQYAAQDSTYTTRINWFGTVRARLGVLINPTLLAYVTGGFAYGEVYRTYGLNIYGADITAGAVGYTIGRGDTWETGWTGGGGVEWALGNRVSIGAEYLYLNLNAGSFVTAYPSGNCTAPNGCTLRVRSNDVVNHLGRIKINYRF